MMLRVSWQLHLCACQKPGSQCGSRQFTDVHAGTFVTDFAALLVGEDDKGRKAALRTSGNCHK